MFRKLIWALDVGLILSMIAILAGNNVGFFNPLMLIYNSFNLFTGILVLIVSLFVGMAIFLIKSDLTEINFNNTDKFKVIESLKEMNDVNKMIPSIIRNAIIILLSFLIKENSIAAVTIFSFASVMILRDRITVYTSSVIDKIKEV